MATTFSPCPNCGAVNRVSGSRRKGSAVCSRCKTPLALEESVSRVLGDGLRTLIAKSPDPVVVDFWADWCGPCKMFAPIFRQAAERMAGKVVFAKLDTEADPQAASHFGIRSIPTLVVFKDGAEKSRFSGAMMLEPFLNWLGDALKD